MKILSSFTKLFQTLLSTKEDILKYVDDQTVW